MRSVHQFIPSLLSGDAAGEHTRLVRELLIEHGVDSIIYAAAWDTMFEPICRPFETYGGGPAIYQFAVGSGVGDFVAEHVEVLAVNSHNVTPPRFFAGWGQPDVQAAASWGEQQLRALAQRASLGVGVSAFNAEGLRRAGFASPRVVPLLLDISSFDTVVDEETEQRLRAGKEGADWLFVGRIVPNKAQHDLVRAFAVHRATFPGSRLWLIGRTDTVQYERALRSLVEDLGLVDAVTLTGAVPASVMAAYYRCADVFVSASEHEGFCVPLLEALHCGVPVVAHASSAVAETLANAGLCVEDKRPASLAAAVRLELTAPDHENRAARARARLAAFALDRTRGRMWSVIEEWLGSTRDTTR